MTKNLEKPKNSHKNIRNANTLLQTIYMDNTKNRMIQI